MNDEKKPRQSKTDYFVINGDLEAQTFKTKKELDAWIKENHIEPHKSDHLQARGFVQDLAGDAFLIIKGRIVWAKSVQKITFS